MGFAKHKIEVSAVQNIPQWAIGYIVYGDDSNIDDDEKMAVDAFLRELRSNGWQIGMPIEDSEKEFNRYPAFGDDCCATVDFYVLKN